MYNVPCTLEDVYKEFHSAQGQPDEKQKTLNYNSKVKKMWKFLIVFGCAFHIAAGGCFRDPESEFMLSNYISSYVARLRLFNK